MICYKDTTFCSSKVKKHTCNREFTKQDKSDAEKWWGGKDYPVAFGKFCEEECIQKKYGRCKGEVTIAPDPYASEINGDETLVAMCEECRYQSAMDI